MLVLEVAVLGITAHFEFYPNQNFCFGLVYLLSSVVKLLLVKLHLACLIVYVCLNPLL